MTYLLRCGSLDWCWTGILQKLGLLCKDKTSAPVNPPATRKPSVLEGSLWAAVITRSQRRRVPEHWETAGRLQPALQLMGPIGDCDSACASH